MAVSGCLKDVKFAEVLKIVGKQTGRLWIYNMNRNNFYEWSVHQNVIRSVRVNSAAVTAFEQIHQAALQLSEDTESSYIFYALKFDKLVLEISLPVDELIIGALAATDGDVASYRDELPHPDTRFQAILARVATLTGNLREFWDSYQKHFANGFSANEIAAQTNLNVEEAQLNLYKLRAVGAIEPVRVLPRQIAPATIVSPEPVPQQLAATTADFDRPTETLAEPQAAADELTGKRQSLIRQMLNAISIRKKDW